MLRIRNLDAGYGNLKVLRHVSLHIKPGEIVSIIGANGAGKTTMLNTIAGVMPAMAGEMDFDKRSLAAVPAEERVFMGCSLVPEGRQVFAPMTVMENLALGAYVQHRRDRPGEVKASLEHVFGLFPKLLERKAQLAGTLSGGEQQMLAIGRALMARPKLIMMDEPSIGLAPLVVKEIFRIIVRLCDEGNTVLLVEQNARAALAISDRGYVLENGRIILQGSAEELVQNRDVQRAYLGRELEANK